MHDSPAIVPSMDTASRASRPGNCPGARPCPLVTILTAVTGKLARTVAGVRGLSIRGTGGLLATQLEVSWSAVMSTA